jgi:hypothetical protein
MASGSMSAISSFLCEHVIQLDSGNLTVNDVEHVRRDLPPGVVQLVDYAAAARWSRSAAPQ